MVEMTNLVFNRSNVQTAFRAQMKTKKTVGVGHQVKFDPIEPYPPLDNVDNAYIQKMHELDGLCERITNGKCRQVPSFLKRLWLILATEDPSIIGWSADGRGIQIRDRARMESIVLPKYYNHSKMRSFQRQLNYFGFKKTNKSKKETLTFGNENFNMRVPTDMAKIQRKLRDRKRGGQKRDMSPSPVVTSKRIIETIEPKQKQAKTVDDNNKENIPPVGQSSGVSLIPNSEVGTLSRQDSVRSVDVGKCFGETDLGFEPSLGESSLPPPPPTLQLEPLKSEDQRWLNSLTDDSFKLDGHDIDLDKLL